MRPTAPLIASSHTQSGNTATLAWVAVHVRKTVRSCARVAIEQAVARRRRLPPARAAQPYPLGLSAPLDVFAGSSGPRPPRLESYGAPGFSGFASSKFDRPSPSGQSPIPVPSPTPCLLGMIVSSSLDAGDQHADDVVRQDVVRHFGPRRNVEPELAGRWTRNRPLAAQRRLVNDRTIEDGDDLVQSNQLRDGVQIEAAGIVRAPRSRGCRHVTLRKGQAGIDPPRPFGLVDRGTERKCHLSAPAT